VILPVVFDILGFEVKYKLICGIMDWQIITSNDFEIRTYTGICAATIYTIGVKYELIIDLSNFLKEKVMEETYFDSNEFFDLKNSFINLQSDNQLDENDNQLDVSIKISKLLLHQKNCMNI
jgi:hypothetical protein